MLTPAAELKPDTLYGRCHLKCPASIRPREVEFPPFRFSGENTAKIFSLGSSLGINKKENTRRSGYDVPEILNYSKSLLVLVRYLE